MIYLFKVYFVLGKSERTDTDKNRERRKKKQKQRKHIQEKEKKEKMISKMRPGLGNPYSKEKAKKMLEKVTKEKNIDKVSFVIFVRLITCRFFF